MAKTKTKEAPTLFAEQAPDPAEKKQEVAAYVADPRGPAPAKRRKEAAASPNDEAVDVLVMLARAAVDPRVDPAKMQALRQIMKDVRDERREESFGAAMIAMQAEMPEIDKNGRIIAEGVSKRTGRAYNQNTPYATFDNIQRVTNPILRRHGFLVWDETEPGKEGTGVVVHTYLKHKDGHQIHSSISLILDTTGSKNNNQGVGSSISYGKRYNRIALLNIVSRAPQDADNDGNLAKDAAVEQAITAEQVAELDRAIKDCGVPFETFCNKYTIEKLPDLLAKHFAQAMKACANFKRSNSGATQAEARP